jgi:glutamate synthase (NADPH/NADH) large chain
MPEHVINYMFFVAEELRTIMAHMGFRAVDEMIGRVDRLEMARVRSHWKASGVDLSRILHAVPPREGRALHQAELQDHALDGALDHELIAACAEALNQHAPVVIERSIRNLNRATGAMLSGRIAEKFGHDGLPSDTIRVNFTGTAGQSFGAWLAHGITLALTGDANDYVGKGLSGGRIVVRPPDDAPREADANIVVGNTVLYGAIAGEAYFAGVAGERFAVRNSGAVAVVEGTGDHACEYMTGGVVCVLGKTGRNFAAGMSGGVAYVYDPDGEFEALCNAAQVDIEPFAARCDRDEGTLGAWNRPQQQSRSVHDSGMGDPLRHDAERLRVLIERHLLHTGSARARTLLDDWENALSKFHKIIPRDYRAALEAIEAERNEAAIEAAE